MPGLEVAEVVRNVRQRLREQAAKVKHEQMPAIYIQADRFYLMPDAGSVTPQTTASPEESFWAALDPTHPCEYQAYLDQYPRGRFAALAKLRLQDCRPVKGARQAPAAPDHSPPVAAAPALLKSQGRRAGASGRTNQSRYDVPKRQRRCQERCRSRGVVSQGRRAGRCQRDTKPQESRGCKVVPISSLHLVVRRSDHHETPRLQQEIAGADPGSRSQ